MWKYILSIVLCALAIVVWNEIEMNVNKFKLTIPNMIYAICFEDVTRLK